MAANKVMKLAISREGKNQYTNSDKRENVFSGYSDCSSLYWKCYEKAYGLYIGSWTGQQVQHGWQIKCWNGKKSLTLKDYEGLEPGDLIFFGSGDAVHVEGYVGMINGVPMLFGHGSGTPHYNNGLTYTHKAGFYQARRYYVEKSSVSSDDPSPLNKITLPTLKRGSNGKAVVLLQACLNMYNYGLDVDGEFGNATEESVRTFQRIRKMTETGNCNKDTWKKILTPMR